MAEPGSLCNNLSCMQGTDSIAAQHAGVSMNMLKQKPCCYRSEADSERSKFTVKVIDDAIHLCLTVSDKNQRFHQA